LRRFAVNFDVKPQMDSFLDLAKEKVKTLGYMADDFELNPAFKAKAKKEGSA